MLKKKIMSFTLLSQTFFSLELQNVLHGLINAGTKKLTFKGLSLAFLWFPSGVFLTQIFITASFVFLKLSECQLCPIGRDKSWCPRDELVQFSPKLHTSKAAKNFSQSSHWMSFSYGSNFLYYPKIQDEAWLCHNNWAWNICYGCKNSVCGSF